MRNVLAIAALALVECGGPPDGGGGGARPTTGDEVGPAITDGAAFLVELEGRLQRAHRIDIRTLITSDGPHPSRLEGTLRLEGADTAWQLSGSFGETPLEITFRADANNMHGGAGTNVFQRTSPPELRDAMVVGLVRMGLLHNAAQLAIGDPPDVRVTGASGFIVLEDVTVGDSTLVDDEFAIPIHAHLRVQGQPMGEATLWIAEATRLPVRREQTVTFPEGTMHVQERYPQFEVTD